MNILKITTDDQELLTRLSELCLNTNTHANLFYPITQYVWIRDDTVEIFKPLALELTLKGIKYEWDLGSYNKRLTAN